MVYVIAFGVFVIMIGLMCIGVIARRPPIRAGCGSKTSYDSKTDSSNTNSSKTDTGTTEQNNVTACGCEPETRANKRLTSRDDHPH